MSSEPTKRIDPVRSLKERTLILADQAEEEGYQPMADDLRRWAAGIVGTIPHDDEWRNREIEAAGRRDIAAPEAANGRRL